MFLQEPGDIVQENNACGMQCVFVIDVSALLSLSQQEFWTFGFLYHGSWFHNQQSEICCSFWNFNNDDYLLMTDWETTIKYLFEWIM